MTCQPFIIIDDDQTFRDVLARSLKRLGCDAEAFDHPANAGEAIVNTESPIVLLDLKLENDSGLRWVKTLKAQANSGKLILLTGYASITTAVEAIKLGADDYLTKPTTAREILDFVNRDLPGEETPLAESPMSVDRLEWEHIQRVLQENDGNISASARALGMHRRTLQRKLAKKPVSR